jgi:hypothetical protein
MPVMVPLMMRLMVSVATDALLVLLVTRTLVRPMSRRIRTDDANRGDGHDCGKRNLSRAGPALRLHVRATSGRYHLEPAAR